MKLDEIVAALVVAHKPSQAEVFKTIMYLLDDAVCDRPTLLKIGRHVKLEVDYEKAPVS